jgi:hypothetical protein
LAFLWGGVEDMIRRYCGSATTCVRFMADQFYIYIHKIPLPFSKSVFNPMRHTFIGVVWTMFL